MNDLGGLVEALLALHQPGTSYDGLGHPKARSCRECLTETWPCPTVRLIAETTGSPTPEPQITPGGVASFHPDWCECGETYDGDDPTEGPRQVGGVTVWPL